MKYGVRACALAMLVILQACSLTACSGQNNNVARTPFPQKSPASSISNDFPKSFLTKIRRMLSLRTQRIQ